MTPQRLQPLFWDVNCETFDPAAHPAYAILRVLEYGDQQAVAWLKQTFSGAQIREDIRGDRRLSRKSAGFWALVYGILANEVRALSSGYSYRDLREAELLELFQEKFARAACNLVHVLKSLTYFEDADKDPMPDMLLSLSWEEVKSFFLSQSPRLL